MNRTEAKKLLVELVDRMTELNKQWKAFQNVAFAATDSPLGNSIFRMEESYVDAVSVALGDDDAIVAWYVFANDMGHRRFQHSRPNGDFLEVCDVDDFLDVLGFEESE